MVEASGQLSPLYDGGANACTRSRPTAPGQRQNLAKWERAATGGARPDTLPGHSTLETGNNGPDGPQIVAWLVRQPGSAQIFDKHSVDSISCPATDTDRRLDSSPSLPWLAVSPHQLSSNLEPLLQRAFRCMGMRLRPLRLLGRQPRRIGPLLVAHASSRQAASAWLWPKRPQPVRAGSNGSIRRFR